MTILSQQLETISQEINANFNQHQQIHVSPIAGNPPDQYRITYHLQGLCKKETGEIQTCTDHIITLTLPFGFPHFPPNCKPESPIFHPDFDQAAICIGEFWENNHSLSELIIHIGRMLCGELYSTNNAFNEEAAAWYQENHNRLPLDTIYQRSAPTPSPPAEHTLAVPASLTMDNNVEDAHFSSSDIIEIDDGEVNGLKDNTGSALPPHLSQHSSSVSPQDQEPNTAVDNLALHHLDKARKEYQKGESFEQQGQPAKALERYRAVKNLAPDFPEIDKDISRAQYSLEMLGNWAVGDPTKKDTAINKKQTTTRKEKQNTPLHKKNASSQQEKNQSSRRPSIIIGCVCLIVVVTLTVSYLFFNSQWDHAQTMLKECKQLLDTDRFMEAEQKCTDAMKATSTIFIIKQQEKKLLTEEIKQIKSSQQLKEGLELSKEDNTHNLPEWQQALKLADQHLIDGKWNDAMVGYNHTLQFASEIAVHDQGLLDQIRNNIIIAQYIQAGEQSLTESEWDSAKHYFDMVLNLAKQNSHLPPEFISRIKSLTSKVEFNKLLIAGEAFFAKEDWTNALSTFKQAQKIEQNSSFPDTTTRVSLQEIIVRTKVFNSLEQGKKAFADAQWDQAINHYDTAIQLLEENNELLRQNNPLQSQQKITKLLLHAAIIRDQQSAANHLKNKELTQAIDKLQAIIKTIDTSSFAREQEFLTIIKETRGSINQAQEDLLLAEQISYLTNNYQRLFTQNNSALIAEKLSHPRVTFLKKIDNKLLFKLQCSEEGRGRPVLHQTSYIYDPTTKKWSFYSNETSATKQETEKIGQEILSSAYKTHDDRLIAEQISYLTDNFRALFIEENPSLLQENLSKPQATFLKKIGEKMLFMLQCLDQGSGTPTLLKVNYLFDPTTNQWELHTNEKNP